jgi:urea transport system permease protein
MKFLAILLFLSGCLLPMHSQADAQTLDEALQLLPSRDFDEKGRAIDLIVASGHDAAERLLNAMLNGDLYYRKDDQRIVLTESADRGYRIFDAVSGEDLGETGKRKVKKVSINNQLRGKLKLEIATLALNHADANVRLQSVEGMIGKADADMLVQLDALKAREKDERVIDAINTVTAFALLQSDEPAQQQLAIEQLQGNLNPVVLGALREVVATTDNANLKKEAQRAISLIEERVKWFGYVETLFFGLSLGSILALAAIGLAITFGVMGVINMAHGELIMIGAYTTYVIQLLMPESIGMSILVAIPAAFVVSALVGIAIERGVIRFLYGRPLETLLATFGISLVLQQAVRSIFSPLNRSVSTPDWMSGSLEINSLLSITYNRLYIFVFCLIVFVLLYLVMKKTSLGLYVRAVSQNRNMARAMGIRSQWVDAMTFGLGSGIAGVAGVALSQVTNVGPNLGQAYIVDSFMVVVFGGVGNLWGTLLSGLSLGVFNKFLEPVSGAVLAKILVLVFIILFIQKRPRGLFPQKGRAAEQ